MREAGKENEIASVYPFERRASGVAPRGNAAPMRHSCVRRPATVVFARRVALMRSSHALSTERIDRPIERGSSSANANMVRSSWPSITCYKATIRPYA